jgi:GTP-binding protein
LFCAGSHLYGAALFLSLISWHIGTDEEQPARLKAQEEKMTDFVDRVVVHLKGGDGGDGAHSIRRERYKPMAGPDGGSGGKGGSVILKADTRIDSLLDLRLLPHRHAQDGTNGKGDDLDGRKGDDIVIPVPVGTVVFQAVGPSGSPRHPGQQLADLRHEGQTFVAAHGGAGGLGNRALANKSHKAPGFALKGVPGEERDLILELKSIADIALVGYPSAGKSSLIAAMSAARPKIANYPFTTLVPSLGVVTAGDDRYTIADVPGLIPGASKGRGLGLQFLRHIERTQVIVHVIDCATYEPNRDPVSDYHALEAELAAYEKHLTLPLGTIPMSKRPRVIVLNKIDVPEARDLATMVAPDFRRLGLPVYLVSTATHEGLKQLRFGLDKEVQKTRQIVRRLAEEQDHGRVVIHPLDLPGARKQKETAPRFNVIRQSDGAHTWFLVTGHDPQTLVQQTDFGNDEAVGYLADQLADMGVEDALRAAGAKAGDEVHIGPSGDEVIFNWEPTISAGAEGLDDAPLVARGQDIRLQNYGYAQRRSNQERRREHHAQMDRRAAARAQQEKERQAGIWTDPSADDGGDGKDQGTATSSEE